MALKMSSTLRKSKKLISKSDLLDLLTPGLPVPVRVVVDRGTIALKSLERQRIFRKVNADI